MNREFTATRPNHKWVADITEFGCVDGKLFLAGIVDLHDRGICGWSMGERQTTDLVVNALEMARWSRGTNLQGLTCHSDAGSQSGFNWSLQHLDEEVVDGQASRVDEGVDGAFAYEVAGCAVASPRGPTGVLACDRNWSDERGGRRCGRRVSGSWKSMVPPWWRNATDGSHFAEGPLLVVS